MSLYRRKDSPYWWSTLYVEGKPVAFSTRERTKAAALRAEREHAHRIEQHAKLPGRYTVASLAAKFLVWKEADGRSQHTVALLARHLEQHILPALGADRDVRTVAVSDLEAYKVARSALVSAVTVAKELSTLRQLLRYAQEVHGLFVAAPTVRNPRIRHKTSWRLLTTEQVSAILSSLEQRRGRGRDALPYFAIMANTGMRGGELSAITWDMVSADGRTINLPATATKNRRARTVPLNDVATAALAIMRARKPLAVGRVFASRAYYSSWRRACLEAGLGNAKGERPRPHDLRHTFGSLLHAAGRSMPEVRDMLGHTTLHMVNLYAHAYEGRLREAAQSVQVGRANVEKNVVEKKPPVERRSGFWSVSENHKIERSA